MMSFWVLVEQRGPFPGKRWRHIISGGCRTDDAGKSSIVESSFPMKNMAETDLCRHQSMRACAAHRLRVLDRRHGMVRVGFDLVALVLQGGSAST